MNNLDYENRNAFMPPLQTIKKKHISLITKIKNIYIYLFIFAIIYIEFGYHMVVENQLNGTIRIFLLIILPFPLCLLDSSRFKSINITSSILFFYFLVLILLNGLRDNNLNNYILLLVPVYLGFMISWLIDIQIFIKFFCRIMLFLASYSLIIFMVGFLFPSLIEQLPFLGYRLDSQAEVHDALFSVFLTNTTYIRNYGLAWEPGAFALLNCFALYFVGMSRKQFRIGYIAIFSLTIVTTFSTMGYAVMAGIYIVLINKLCNQKQKRRMLKIGGIFLVGCIIVLSFQSIREVVFSKLRGLFLESDGEVSYTTQARLNAIIYPFKAFLSSPIIGIGYDSFSILNIEKCNGVATNTILNWFALFGSLFGLPCIYFYLRVFLNHAKIFKLNIFSIIILLLSFILLLSTESLLRISLIYIIIFYSAQDLPWSRDIHENSLYFRSL